jgi:glycine betaine/proline transport system permease protein
MEWLQHLITDHKLPIGDWARVFVDWLTTNFPSFFDGLSNGLRIPIEGLVGILEDRVNPLVFCVVAALLAFWLQRSWKVGLFIFAGLLLILNLDLWNEMIETLVLVTAASFVSLVIGIPVGILAARRAWIYQTLAPILDMMQTIPTFVYLVPTLVLFGLGIVPGLIATVIEAGEAFGCTRWQLLVKVKLPAALPTIMAGVTQCIMLSLSMVVIAALVGAGGLGTPTVRALAQSNVSLGVEAGIAIVIVAIGLDRVLKQRARQRVAAKPAKG